MRRAFSCARCGGGSEGARCLSHSRKRTAVKLTIWFAEGDQRTETQPCPVSALAASIRFDGVVDSASDRLAALPGRVNRGVVWGTGRSSAKQEFTLVFPE